MSWLSKMLFGDVQEESYEERLARGAGSDQPSSHGIEPRPYESQDGQKMVPTVSIERVESHLSGDMHHVEVWVHIKNHSVAEVEVTRVNFWRQHINPGRFLKPGESHEIRIYSGDTRHDDAERECEVHFKLVETGDYFQADHRIDYRYEQTERDKFYIPEEMHLIEPIRDI